MKPCTKISEYLFLYSPCFAVFESLINLSASTSSASARFRGVAVSFSTLSFAL